MSPPAVLAAPGPLLEREAELELIDALLAAAGGGAGAAVAIVGRAGVGKTRLLREVRRHAELAGFTVLSACGGELERGFPHGVVRQLFEPALARSAASERAELLDGAAALAAPALDMAAAGVTAPSGGDRAFAVAHGLYWLAANLASRAPVAVCVDDAHWSDEQSVQWLGYLASRLDGLPLVLFMGARPAEAAGDALPRLLGDSRTHVLEPAALSAEAVATLVEVRAGQAAEPVFCAACHRATGGNPFLLEELLRTVAADGQQPDAAGADRVPELGARAVARAIQARVARLPEDAGRLAEAVAILGGEVALRHAAGLARLTLARAAEHADALAAADVLRPGRPLEFVHPIVRHAAYTSMAAGARARGHARAARLLEKDGAVPEVVAEHLVHADPAGDPSAVAALRRAAESALRRGASEAAVRYLNRSLAEPPAADERAGVLLALGSAELRSGPAAEAGRPAARGEPPDQPAILHLREAHRLLTDPGEQAAAARALGDALLATDRYAEAVDVFSSAAEALGERDAAAAQQLEAHLTFAGWLEESTCRTIVSRLERGPPPSQATSAGRLLLGVLAAQRTLAGAGVEEVVALAEAALPTGEILCSDVTPHASNHVGLALMWAERYERAADLFGRMLAEGRATGDLRATQMALCFRAHVAYRRGDVAEAEADAEEALALATAEGWRIGIPVTRAAVALARLERGDAAAAEEVLLAAQPDSREPDSGYWGWICFLDARARARMALGRPHEALVDFLAAGRRLAAWGPAGTAFLPWRAGAALALAALDEHAAARRRADEEVALARAFGAPGALGVALRAAGLVAPPSEAGDLLAEAVAALERSASRLELARALTDHGAALRRAGERHAARHQLRRGLDLAHRCGARALAGAAHEELLATGARPRRVAMSGVDALTASERRVAAMAARGLGNRQIAQALFVTQRTIETHLSRTYQKLAIHSRAELARAFQSGDG